MDSKDIERLARDIEELKLAVKKNDPLLREILTRKGWILLGLGGGLGVTLFAVPAHILSSAYGSFGAIPPLGRALLWAALVLASVGGGVWKLLLINRKVAEVDRDSGLGEIMDSFFGAASIHVTGGMLVAIAVAVAFSVASNRPWYAVPAIGMLLGIWMNAIGSQTRVAEYLVSGWWSILASAFGVFLVERAPFLWVLIIFGGMFYSFSAAIALSPRPRRKVSAGGRSAGGGAAEGGE